MLQAGSTEMGWHMLSKMIAVMAFVVGVAFSLTSSSTTVVTGSNKAVDQPIIEKVVEYGDTYACPRIDGIIAYLNEGLSEKTQSCSPIVWAHVGSVESLGPFVMPFADVFDEYGKGVPLDTFVEVFRVQYEGVELFAIQEMYDFHAMDEPAGLKPGVAYFVWQDRTSAVPLLPQG